MPSSKSLTDQERAIYEWQMWVTDFGEAGQEKLKAASVMISRVGGVGSSSAWAFASGSAWRRMHLRGQIECAGRANKPSQKPKRSNKKKKKS